MLQLDYSDVIRCAVNITYTAWQASRACEQLGRCCEHQTGVLSFVTESLDASSMQSALHQLQLSTSKAEQLYSLTIFAQVQPHMCSNISKHNALLQCMGRNGD